jgi:predicted ester cyclase
LSNSNESALRAAVEGFNDPDERERWLDLYSPYVVLHGYPRGLEGHDGARRFYEQLWTAFPDARLTLEDVIEAGDRIAIRYRLSGIDESASYGAGASGNVTEIEGMAWIRFADGQAVEVWQTSGTLDTLVRLSARASSAPRRSASAEAAALKLEERGDL